MGQSEIQPSIDGATVPATSERLWRRRGLLAGAAALVGAAASRLIPTDGARASHSSSDGIFHIAVNNTNGTGSTTQLSGAGGGADGALKVTNTSGRGIVAEATTGNYNGVSGKSSGSASGVFGESVTGAASGHGVHGEGYYGVYGKANSAVSGAAGVYGDKGSATNAGYFFGTVTVEGDFSVTGSKSALVPHPDGTYRFLYCTEAPEPWFEDFGTGQLSSGQATVTIESTFAQLIVANNYYVQLTAEGDCRGLFVTGKSANGFTVRELQGGSSSVAFTYRLVARRKDVAGQRLAVGPTPLNASGVVGGTAAVIPTLGRTPTPSGAPVGSPAPSASPTPAASATATSSPPTATTSPTNSTATPGSTNVATPTRTPTTGPPGSPTPAP